MKIVVADPAGMPVKNYASRRSLKALKGGYRVPMSQQTKNVWEEQKLGANTRHKKRRWQLERRLGIWTEIICVCEKELYAIYKLKKKVSRFYNFVNYSKLFDIQRSFCSIFTISLTTRPALCLVVVFFQNTLPQTNTVSYNVYIFSVQTHVQKKNFTY